MPRTATARSGTVVIGFDGSPSSEKAVAEAGSLLAPRRALVVVVWEPDAAFEAVEIPTIPPAPIDIRSALELDDELYERARRLAQHGAELARESGLDATGLAVADDVTVAETLLRLADDHNAQAVVIGAHGHSVLRELVLGGTAQRVVGRARCPVVIVRSESR